MNKSRKFGALILIMLVLCVTGLKAVAQDDDEPHGVYVETPRVFYGGLVAGVNLSQVDGDYYAGYYKKGANVGGIIYAQLAKHVALSMEILYSQKGSKSNEVEPSEKEPNTYILNYGINNNYAEVPVMINYFDKRKSHCGIGLSYSRLVSSTENLQIDSLGSVRSVDLSNYTFRKDNLDFLIGAELHLWQGLFLNVRFQYSILPIRTDIPEEYARASQYNNMWVVRLMYLLK